MVTGTLDAAGLKRLLVRLGAAVDALEAQNEGSEDASPVHLPAELAEKEALRERVRSAMEKLAGSEELERINLTDEDARLMKSRQGIVPAYNAQAMVSPVVRADGSGGMVITAAEVVTDPNDFGQLEPMMERAEEATEVRSAMTLADSGRNVETYEERGQRVAMPESQDRALRGRYHKDRFIYDAERDSYLCPEGRRLRFTRTKRTRGTLMKLYRGSGSVCRACPAFGVCTKDGRHGRALEIGPHDDALKRHRAWMSTDEAAAAYRRRQGLVEPVFGIIIAWRQTKRIGGGGPMLDDGVHALDTMVFLLGRMWEVSSFCDTLTRDRDVEDTASVMVKFENGAQGMLECYSSVPNFQGRRVLRVYGSEGVLLALETLGPPSDKNRLFRFTFEDGLGVESEPEEVDGTPVLMCEAQFRLFSDAVAGGTPYSNSGEEGPHVQRVIDGVFRSSDTRQVVAIED